MNTRSIPSRRVMQLDTAQYLQRQFRAKGVRTAAGYLRNRGWSIEAALWTLCGTEVRP